MPTGAMRQHAPLKDPEISQRLDRASATPFHDWTPIPMTPGDHHEQHAPLRVPVDRAGCTRPVGRRCGLRCSPIFIAALMLAVGPVLARQASGRFVHMELSWDLRYPGQTLEPSMVIEALKTLIPAKKP